MMSKFLLSRASLRQMLIVPYVTLVILAAAIIGMLSYLAGRDAVNTLLDQSLSETVSRIALAIDKHISGSEAVLETAFPSDIPAPTTVDDELDTLRTRFWLATSIHRDPNNYVYYGSRKGEFIGLWRNSETEAELRLRVDGVSPRSIYQYSRINGELVSPTIESRVFEPRDRPWYKAGQITSTQTWTAIYIDFRTLELVSTRARSVNNALGEFEGVVATDLSMQHLNEFLVNIKLSPNGFAFIVEPDGNLVATSRGPHLAKSEDGTNTRLNAGESGDPWISTAYQALQSLTQRKESSSGLQTTSFKGPGGEVVQAGYTRLQDAAGLDWIVAVAAPRNDFMQNVTQNVNRTALMAFIACLLIALTGYGVLSVIARDLRKLSVAAKAIGEGNRDVESTIPIDRGDEIGDLARSFATMQQQLLTTESRSRALMESAPDSMILLDESGTVRTVNAQAINMFGYTRANFVGMQIDQLLPQKSWLNNGSLGTQNLLGPGSPPMGTAMEVSGKRKDGTEFPAEVSLGAVGTLDEPYVAASIRDISNRKQLETEASELRNDIAHMNRLVTMGEMATGLAHELNQPLTAIIQHTDTALVTLQRSEDSGSELEGILIDVDAEAQRAGGIIRALRQFLQKDDSSMVHFQLNELVRQTVQLVAAEAHANNVLIKLACDALPEVRANRVQIAQVIVNLLRNSLDAITAEQCETRIITVSTICEHERVVLSVEDTGPGIDAGTTLFEPFRTNKPEGMGMGLSISRSIIKAHGGKMWCDYERQSGACLCFSLPLSDLTESPDKQT